MSTRATQDEHGKPVYLHGVPHFSDPNMPRNYQLDPAAWARALCPIHGLKPITTCAEVPMT